MEQQREQVEWAVDPEARWPNAICGQYPQCEPEYLVWLGEPFRPTDE